MTFEIQPRKGTPEITGDGVVYGGKRFQVDCKLAGNYVGGYRDVLTLSRVAVNTRPARPAAMRTTPAISVPWIDDR
jgi:hypothetical protein